MADENVENQADETTEPTEGTAEESTEANEDTAVATEASEESAEGETAEAGAEAAAEPAEGAAAPVEVQTEAVKPDIKFVRDVMGSGGHDLKKCYQCATCSVVCNLTPDDNPFPRKEMQWAQWGLKDKLMASPDIWLCHQCSDCVAQCPRDAKPGKVLQAVAKMNIANYSGAGLTKAVGNIGGTLLLSIIPIAIILIALAIQGSFSDVPLKDGKIVYSNFMATTKAIDPIFSIAFIFAGIVMVIGGRRYWNDMMDNHTKNGGKKPAKGFFANLGPTLTEFLAHKRFRECDETKDRANSHLLIFYGFVGLFLTTAWAVVYFYFLPLVGLEAIKSPFPFTNPIKWLGNISAAAGIIGITMVLIYRFVHAERVGIGSYFDWLLITVIYIILLSGIGAEIFRLTDTAAVAYPVYTIHLISVLFLFIYAPFSKMAHMIYRAVALVFARATGRDVGVGV